ncbi:hypothetical protein [Kitasatospora sp. NPDC054795]
MSPLSVGGGADCGRRTRQMDRGATENVTPEPAPAAIASAFRRHGYPWEGA